MKHPLQVCRISFKNATTLRVIIVIIAVIILEEIKRFKSIPRVALGRNPHQSISVWSKFCFFYFTIQGMVKYCNCTWKKYFFFATLFWNISKTAETTLLKKIEGNHGGLLYKKALMSEHEKMIFYEIGINDFVKMSVS